MSYLHYFRIKRSFIARNILAMFSAVLVMLSFQPCAMAFNLEADNSTDMATMMMAEMDQPCDHCPEPENTADCQFDDIGSPNQLVSLSQDAKPNPSIDKVIVVLALTTIKPQSLAPPFTEPRLKYTFISTPTLKQDIILC